MTFSWKYNPKLSDFSKEIPYQNAENSVSELLDFLLVPRPASGSRLRRSNYCNASLVYAKSGYGPETGTITYCFETISKNSRCLRPCLYKEKLSRESVSTRKKLTLKLQNRAARVITKSPFDASSNHLLSTLSWERLSLRRKKQKALMMYKTVVV